MAVQSFELLGGHVSVLHRGARTAVYALAGVALLAGAAAGQATATRPVTGRVIDVETRQGVAGARVSVVGQSALAAQTNDSGAFRLNVPLTPVTLLVRMFGRTPRQVVVSPTQASVEITLQRDVLNLDRVVVTGQATSVQSANAATAVSTISAEDLANVAAASMEVSMQGKVVGASINMNSGAPGGGGQVQIRGVTSLIGNGEPLYVVDGVLISNAAISSGQNALQARGSITSQQDNLSTRLADINQNDIEDVQVLKGASASAIYGAKATNGVIVITTKKGATGAARFSLTQRLGTSSVMRLPGSRRFNTVADLYAAQPAQKAIIDSIVAANGGVIPYYDYQNQLYGQDKPSHETVATVSGGTADTKYFVSGSNKYDNGVMINTDANRQSGRVNLSQTLGSRWTTDVGLNLVHSVNRRGLSNNSTDWVGPLYLLSYTPAIVNLNSRTASGLYVRNPFAGGGGSQASNPFESMDYITNSEFVDRQIGSLNLKYSALSTTRHSLQFTALGGADQFSYDAQIYSPPFMQYEPQDGLLGTAVESHSRARNTNAGLNAIWIFTPGRSFVTTATTSGGVSNEKQFLNEYRIRAQGLSPGVDLISQGSIDDFQNKTLVKNLAYYAQEEILAFGERLYLQGAFRADRSSVNGESDKFYVFPKGSASYRFVSPLPRTDEVKLRVAIGTSGNQPLYGLRDFLLSSSGIIEGQNSIVPSQRVGNLALQPEKMTETELGIDAAFLDHRATIEATYFDRTITDMLLQQPLVPSSGLGNRTINGGKMTSKGQELALNLVLLQRKGLDWSFRTQYYHIDQKIVSLPIAPFAVGNTGFGTSFGRSVIKEGYSTTGIWANTFRANGTVVDTLLGDATPKFTMQFSSRLAYKAVVMGFLLDWKKGGDVVDITQNRMDEGKNSRDYDDPSPDLAVGKTLGEYRYNKWASGNNAAGLIQDGSFVKLREVSVSYAVPSSLLQRLPVARSFRDLRISASGRNIGMWSGYWGADPEFNNFSNSNTIRVIDLDGYPPSRSYFISLELGY
jgi:TonB-linked SusC/RagA family outer membrane protein